MCSAQRGLGWLYVDGKVSSGGHNYFGRQFWAYGIHGQSIFLTDKKVRYYSYQRATGERIATQYRLYRF